MFGQPGIVTTWVWPGRAIDGLLDGLEIKINWIIEKHYIYKIP